MFVRTNFVYLPGDVSLDVVGAIAKALEVWRFPIVKSKQSSHYLQRLRSRLNASAPAVLQKPVSAALPRWQPRSYLRPLIYETKESKFERVRREMLDAGVTLYGLHKSESRVLPKVLHPDEHVEAVVYGQHHSSSVMLVATNERIIFLDKKPMALFLDEVTYEVVSGIEFEIHTLFATLILHTPVKNYDIHMANLHCAENFARHIEAHRLKREEETEPKESESSDQLKEVLESLLLPQKVHEFEDMAGYSWLPMKPKEDEEEEAAPQIE